MNVKVLKTFKDQKGKAIRKIGETFEVTEKRFKEINTTTHGILVEEIKEVTAKNE